MEQSRKPEGRFSVSTRFVKDRGRSVIPVGVHYVPTSGPDWPWRVGVDEFDRAFALIAHHGLDSVRIDLIWAAVEPEEGQLDGNHLEILDAICDSARAHGLTIHPTLFVGGEVGDAYWDLPWASGVNPHSDPTLLQRQLEHAARLAERWRDRDEIIAWDLTDEPPFWVHGETTTDEHARAWTQKLVEVLKTHDPRHLVTIGTASQEVDGGPFRADVVAEHLDFACVHPYPNYSPELYADRLLSRRMTHAAAFETALASGAGKPVMVHEFGAPSCQFTPEVVRDYDHLQCWSSFGAGAIGFYAWCWADAENAAYRRAPYVRMPHETQFGLVDSTGKKRPRLDSLVQIRRLVNSFDLDALAGKGPWCPASIPVPHEYVHPWDEAAYGLDEGKAGPYVPAEKAWDPERDVKPLVRGWLNAYVMAARAGLPAAFPREQLDDQWPTTPVVLLPAPLTTTTNSLLHMRTSFWDGAEEYVRRGGTLYLSCSADTAIPELQTFAGVRIRDRAPVEEELLLRVTHPFAGLDIGDEIRMRAGSADLHVRGVELEVEDALVLARTQSGLPALTLARRGEGACVLCAYPIELLEAAIPDAHENEDETWRIMRLVRDLAGCQAPIDLDDARLTRGVLRGYGGGILVVTNHGNEDVTVPVTSATDGRDLRLYCPDGDVVHAEVGPKDAANSYVPLEKGEPLCIPAHSCRLVTWQE